MNLAALCWLALAVFFLLVEAAVKGSMTTLWFAIGSLAAMVAAVLGAAFWLQFSIFTVISAVLLLSLRPLLRKYVTPTITKTNVDAVVNSVGLVTVAIDNIDAVGQVKVGSVIWTARSTSGDPIPEGTQVRVDRIEGVKAFVSPVQIAVS